MVSLLGLSWNVHLTWDPQIRGMLFVGIAVVLLIGSVFLVIATNTGFRMGLWITMTGLFAWLTLLTAVWSVYALKQGPPDPSTHEAKWIVKEIITGDVASQTGYAPSSDFAANGAKDQNGWRALSKDDKDYGDAVAASDNALVPPAPLPGVKEKPVVQTWKGVSPFSDTTNYIVVGTYYKGGESYWPLNVGLRDMKDPRNHGQKEINCADAKNYGAAVVKTCSNPDTRVQCSNGSGENCVDLKMCSSTVEQGWLARSTSCQARHLYYRLTKGFLHKPHYAVIQVQPVVPVDLSALPLGSAPPAPTADTSKPITTIVAYRKLGTQRILPAVWFVCSLTIFVVLGYGLHRRDKAIWALKESQTQVATT